VQEVQAARNVDGDVAASPLPVELVVVVSRQRVPQVAALNAGETASAGSSGPP